MATMVLSYHKGVNMFTYHHSPAPGKILSQKHMHWQNTPNCFSYLFHDAGPIGTCKLFRKAVYPLRTSVPVMQWDISANNIPPNPAVNIPPIRVRVRMYNEHVVINVYICEHGWGSNFCHVGTQVDRSSHIQ